MRLVHVARLSRLHYTATGIVKRDEQAETWARANGHEIVATAKDVNVSGSSDPFRRPGLGPWLTDVTLLPLFDGLLAVELDRFGRSAAYLQALRNWCENHDKKLIVIHPALQWPASETDAVSQHMWTLLSVLAEYELAAMTKRTGETRSFLEANEFLTGKPSYGYRPARKGNHKTLEPDPVTASVVRDIVDWFLAGVTVQGIVHRLNERGIPSPNGRKWATSVVSRLLNSPALFGVRKSAEGRVLLRHEGILDAEKYALLRSELARRARARTVSPETPLLSGHVFCECGAPMTKISCGRHPKRHFYYRCRGNPSCFMVKRADAERMADERIRADLATVPRMKPVFVPGEDVSRVVARIDADLARLDQDAPDYDERHAELRAQRRVAQDAGDRVEWVNTGLMVGAEWAAADLAGRRRIMRDISARFVFSKPGGIVKMAVQWALVYGRGLDQFGFTAPDDSVMPEYVRNGCRVDRAAAS